MGRLAVRALVVALACALAAAVVVLYDDGDDVAEATVSVTAGEGGAADDIGEAEVGSTVTAEARPFPGWEFSGWYSGDVLVSEDREYSFRVDGDVSLRAVFSRASYAVTASVEGSGTVSGTGSYAYEDTATLTASAARDWLFSGWYEGGQLRSVTPTYRFAVYGDIGLTAVFAEGPTRLFEVPSEAPQAGEEFRLEPVEGWSPVSWTFRDAYSGKAVEPASRLSSIDGTLTLSFVSPLSLEVTCRASSADGSTSEFTDTVMVDGDVVREYRWTYTYLASCGGDMAWGRVCLEDDGSQTLSLTETLRFSDYVSYREREVHDEIDMGSDYRTAPFSEMATVGDPLVADIAAALDGLSAKLTPLQRAQLVLDFVTCAADYASDEDTRGILEWYRFPYETLYDRQGDCEDTAILFAAIAGAMGFDTAVFDFPEHAMGGVALEGCGGRYVEDGGERFYFCETTADYVHWEVGELPSDYTESDARIEVVHRSVRSPVKANVPDA